MRIFSPLLIFILAGFAADAQKYFPFPTAADTAVWRQITFGRGRPTSIEYWVNGSLTTGKDTVYKGKTYISLNSVYIQYFRDNNGPVSAQPGEIAVNHAFREENKRIYKMDFDNEVEEYLEYDFNVKTGDTIKRVRRGKKEEIYIFATDSILLNDGFYHKTYTESWYGTEPTNVVAEGIGRIKYVSEAKLECYSLNGKPIYKSNDYSRCGPAIDYNPDIVNYKRVGVVEAEKSASEFKIFPNPTSGNLTIQTQSIFSDSYICVRDVLGRIVHREKLQSPNQTIIISNQPKGLYFVEL